MNELSGKVLYLRGLADGLQVDESTKEGKLLGKIIDVLEDFAAEIYRIEQEQEDQGDSIDSLQEEVEELAEAFFDDEEDDEDWDEDDEDDEEWEEGNAIRELGEGSFIEYECPHCKSKIYYDAKAFDLSEDHSCPDCGKELFPQENGE